MSIDRARWALTNLRQVASTRAQLMELEHEQERILLRLETIAKLEPLLRAQRNSALWSLRVLALIWLSFCVVMGFLSV